MKVERYRRPARVRRVLTASAIVVIAGPAHAARAQPADALAEGFRTPPQAARPQVWWHWMSGNVTAQGAQLDLAWMRRVGVGGVHAFSGGGLEPVYVDKPLPFMSPGWRAAYKQAVATAHAYGMEVTIAGSPGWSETGGPWVAPAQGMKKYVWSETQVDADRAAPIVLSAPPTTTGPFLAAPRPRPRFAASPSPSPSPPRAYGDARVFAFPTPAAESGAAGAYSSSAGPLAGLSGLPTDLAGSVSLPLPPGDAAPWIEVDLGRAADVRALTLAATPSPGFEVLARDATGAFRTVARFAADDAEQPSLQQTFAFAPVHARVLRVRFERPAAPRRLPGLPTFFPPAVAPAALEIRTLRFVGGARADRFEAKAGFEPVADFEGGARLEAGVGAVVARGAVVDLTSRMRPDGALDWTPPPGRWTIVRLGWSLTGQTNGPAEAAATGLEVDKLDANAVGAYAEHLLSLYGRDVGAPLGAGGIDSLLTDSWEAGVQNWTPAILADFARLRGYDPTPWLPVLVGRVVQDAQASDAFLFDFRRTLKDLVVSNHYAVLARAAHDHGMRYYTEVQGDTPRAISDGLTAKAQSDIPTGEFWYRPFATDPGQPSLVADLEEAASAAHLYGKPLVAAESMTVAAGDDPWSFSPAMLKPVADEIFAHGVNRILVHESHMQPYADRKPGLMLGFFGQFFNRNDTWAEQARPWSDYLARTAFMLQQGRAVADVAYVYGEEKTLTELFQHRFDTAVPPGYGFDYVDPSGLTGALEVRGDRIVSRGGATYRVIYLPAHVTRMTLPALRKLDALVRAGAVLVARKPVGGLGLRSPDAAVRAIADRLWGLEPDGAPGRRVGRGRVYATADLAGALKAEGLAPDVDVRGANLLTLHRRTADADIYFVSNREARAVRPRIAFRVTGRAPEFWSADDARMRPLSYRQDGGVTRVDLPLDAQGAGFVVFRRRTAAVARTVADPRVLVSRPLDGAWDVAFEPGRGAPARVRFDALADWSRNADPGVRYFSGAASYSRDLTVDATTAARGTRTWLDLGVVDDLAVVSLDGREVATAWKPPYRVDLTGRLAPGPHRLEVKVVNLWPNRLIGDRQPGATPVAWAPQSPYTAASPLRPSGLLGPVRLVQETDPASPPPRAHP